MASKEDHVSDEGDAKIPASSSGEGDTSGSAEAASAEQSTLPVTTDDLIPLIKAITFAYPDFIDVPEKIHHEIVSVASRTEPILTSITLDQVRIAYETLKERVRKEDEMKQRFLAGIQGGAARAGGGAEAADKPLKLYTVGEAGDAAAAESINEMASVAEDTATATTPVMGTGVAAAKRWVYVPLFVPADTSGSKPHQALINFSDQTGSSSSNENSTGDKVSPSDDSFIVKIQLAMGGAEMRTPMLLYNSDRTIKTFVHSTAPTSDAYRRIQGLILGNGQEGALGRAGGIKGYFFAKKYVSSVVLKQCATPEEAIAKSKTLCIDCLELAPNQTW